MYCIEQQSAISAHKKLLLENEIYVQHLRVSIIIFPNLRLLSNLFILLRIKNKIQCVDN